MIVSYNVMSKSTPRPIGITSDVIHNAVIMDKQNVVVYQKIKFQQFEHNQVYSADVQGNNIQVLPVILSCNGIS